jgi:hypothetical protein
VVDGQAIALAPGTAEYAAFTCHSDVAAAAEITAGSLCTTLRDVLAVAALAGNVIVITSAVTATVSRVDVTDLSKPVFSLMPVPVFSLAGSAGPAIALHDNGITRLDCRCHRRWRRAEADQLGGRDRAPSVVQEPPGTSRHLVRSKRLRESAKLL